MIERDIKYHIDYPFAGDPLRAQADQDIRNNSNSIDSFLLKTINLLTILYQRFRAIKSSVVHYGVSVSLWRKANSFILLNKYKIDTIYPYQIVQNEEGNRQICLMASNRFVFQYQTNFINPVIANFATTVKEYLTLANIFIERNWEKFQYVRNTYYLSKMVAS
jgi:hypothetical protein